MAPFMARLAAKPVVLGVYLLSSGAATASNPTRFDAASDFDVAVVLDVPMASSEWRPACADTYRLLADRIPRWMPNFSFRVPVPWGSMEVNVHQLIFDYENDDRTSWNGDKCDAYLHKREVVFERDPRFGQLVGRKARAARIELEAERIRLANRISWDIAEMPARQAERLGPPSGHHLLTVAVDEVMDYLFLLHGRFVPHPKWKLGQLTDGSLLSTDQAGLLQEAMRCDPGSLADLRRRVRCLVELCDSIEGLDVSGPAALARRRGFQERIQLRTPTVADGIAAELGAAAGHVPDLANFWLCESGADLPTGTSWTWPEGGPGG